MLTVSSKSLPEAEYHVMLHWKPFDEMLSCDYSISTVSLIVVECLTKYLPEYSAVPNDKDFFQTGRPQK